MSLLNDYKAYKIHTGSAVKPLLKVMFLGNVFFRLSNLLYSIRLVPLARLFWLLNRILFSIDIDPRATMKKGFVMLHGAGIVIGRYVIAEGNFKIYQGATLGGNMGKSGFHGDRTISQPVILDNVVIGINAVVLGPVVIGEDSAIGANAVVTKSVPPSSIVIGSNTILNKHKTS